jgi:prepilin-type N-terminal cleavage/methylation domain-containing protein
MAGSYSGTRELSAMTLPVLHAARRRTRTSRGFSLIEVLIAVLLLSMSMAAIVRLWSISRSVTERSRDWGEYYAVARQEVERDKSYQFKVLYITESRNGTSRISDYDESGRLLTIGLAAATAPTTGAYYRAYSTYSLVSTGFDTEDTRKLGIQVVKIYRKNGTVFDTGTAIYQTTAFYSVAGI